MNTEQNDSEYLHIIKEIVNDEEFLKLKDSIHHGTNRYDHSLRVAYMAFNYAKKRDLDYKTITKGALLHDFFENPENLKTTDRIISTFIHPKKALKNAKNKYELNEIEEDIIISHMFPINLRLPKYKESWIVSLCDKRVAIDEFLATVNFKFKLTSNLLLIILLSFIN